MYTLLGISLLLGSLLTLNALASLVAGAVWRLAQPALRGVSARLRAEILFTLRISAPAIAIIAVALLFIPSFLRHEPHGTAEVVSLKMATLAVLSAAGVALAISRALRSWFATTKLLRDWLARATRIDLEHVSTPAFSIPHQFPIIAVVGTMRPRLFIAERVLQSLSKEELRASIAHEAGHLNARDNLKRSLLRACRDLLMLIPSGRSLDRAWAEAAECAADDYAANEGAKIALDLASALVKIARMIPARRQAAMPLAVFLVGVEESRGVKARIRRLLDLASKGENHSRPVVSPIVRILPAIAVVSLLAIGLTVAANPQTLVSVHLLIERVVHVLS
jgi:Zn-dependent protease with chaperone function